MSEPSPHTDNFFTSAIPSLNISHRYKSFWLKNNYFAIKLLIDQLRFCQVIIIKQ